MRRRRRDEIWQVRGEDEDEDGEDMGKKGGV
jgi:hypothetical protein